MEVFSELSLLWPSASVSGSIDPLKEYIATIQSDSGKWHPDPFQPSMLVSAWAFD